ncbi:hypothetical protein MAR_006723 [Mya arenaria]|uniref:Uncharacterized protein n=1 Tax=Mya arenaria TaxID=6604 RepID=A0ABY7D9C9_MYAAR|nr:hypothetical protein MAR_006723 [Mya arenaria]
MTFDLAEQLCKSNFFSPHIDSWSKNGSNCKPVLCPLGRLFTTKSKCSFISNYFSVKGLSIFLKIDLKTPILVHPNNSTGKYVLNTPKILAKPFNVWGITKAFHSVLKISQSVSEIRYLALYMEFKTPGPLDNVILDEIEDFMMGDVHIDIGNSKSLCSVEIFPCNIQRFNVEEKYNTNIDRWIEITDKPLPLNGYYALAEYHFCYLIQLCDLEIDLTIFLKTKVVIKQTGMVLYDYQFQYIETEQSKCVRVCIQNTPYQLQVNGSSDDKLIYLEFKTLCRLFFLPMYVMASILANPNTQLL